MTQSHCGLRHSMEPGHRPGTAALITMAAGRTTGYVPSKTLHASTGIWVHRFEVRKSGEALLVLPTIAGQGSYPKLTGRFDGCTFVGVSSFGLFISRVRNCSKWFEASHWVNPQHPLSCHAAGHEFHGAILSYRDAEIDPGRSCRSTSELSVLGFLQQS